MVSGECAEGCVLGFAGDQWVSLESLTSKSQIKISTKFLGNVFKYLIWVLVGLAIRRWGGGGLATSNAYRSTDSDRVVK